MTCQSYEEAYDRDFWTAKMRVLKLADDYRMPGIEKTILLASDFDALKKCVANHEYLSKRLFNHLRYRFEHSSDPDEMESALVDMALLLDWHDPVYAHYRQLLKKRFSRLMDPYLDSDIYCLMRHLMKPGELKKWLESIPDDDPLQQYFLCHIYLIEGNTKKAYHYLKTCPYTGVLLEYDGLLRAADPYRYRRVIQKVQPRHFWEGHGLWMKKQLKF